MTDRSARSVTASAAALFADLVELQPAARERRLAGLESSEPDLARTVRGMSWMLHNSCGHLIT